MNYVHFFYHSFQCSQLVLKVELNNMYFYTFQASLINKYHFIMADAYNSRYYSFSVRVVNILWIRFQKKVMFFFFSLLVWLQYDYSQEIWLKNYTCFANTALSDALKLFFYNDDDDHHQGMPAAGISLTLSLIIYHYQPSFSVDPLDGIQQADQYKFLLVSYHLCVPVCS